MAVSYTLTNLAPAATANSITVGPDKNIWFTIGSSNGIGVGAPYRPRSG